MNEYRVQWTKCPTAYNTTHVLFVEAGTPADAEAVARNHIERKLGVGGWIKFEVAPVEPVPAGRVLEDRP
jgi:hypothetical protein